MSFWIEAQALKLRLSSNLLRCIDLAFNRFGRCCLRDFLSLPDFYLTVKLCLHSLRGRSTRCWQVLLACESQPAYRMNVPLKVVALRKISKSDQQTTLEPLGLTGDKSPGSCNGLFSEGFPTGVQGLLPHLTQRTIFPLPSSGRLKATGRIHCSNCNFQRVTQPLFIRKPRPSSGCAVCDFQRVAQPLSVCKCFPMFRLAVLAAFKE